MIDVKRFYEFLVETKTKICEIKTIKTVYDDSQIVEEMRDVSPDDSMILMGVIPEYDSGGSKNVDSILFETNIAIFVLQKVDYSDVNNDKLLDFAQETQDVVKKIIEQIQIAAVEGNNNCTLFSGIIASSFSVKPIWKLAQCIGWVIAFNVE